MAIDPLKRRMQVRALKGSAPEVACSICGGRTRDTMGSHSRCRNFSIFARQLPKMDTEQVVQLLDRCRFELQKRRDALTNVLGQREVA